MLLTIAAVGLWAYSLLLSSLNIGFYGLIESYHYTYFIALGLLTFSSFILWNSSEGHGKLLALQLCLFIVMLWLTPVIAGANAPSTDWSYSIYFPNSDYIARTGHFNTGLLFNDYSPWSMQNWPGAFLFEAALMKLGGASTVDFMALYSPLLMQFLILPPLYIFYRNTISNPNHRWAACWLFFLANWTAQLYFCPQAFGMLFLVTILGLISRTAFWRGETETVGQQFSLVLILVGVVITHMLTSIVAFLSVGMLWVTRVIRGINLALLAGVLVAFWTIYGAVTQLQVSLPGYIERAFRLDLIFQLSALSGDGTASSSLLWVTYGRYAFTMLIAVTGVAGFLVARKHKDKPDLAVFSLLVPAGLVLFSMLYGYEFWQRVFLFSLIPVAYFAARLLRAKAGAAIFILALLLALPLSIVSQYGFAAVDYERLAEHAYWHFAMEDGVTAQIFGGTRLYYPGYTYSRFYLDQASWQDSLLVLDSPSGNRAQYVHTGEKDLANYQFYQDNTFTVPQTADILESSPYYSLVYANPNVNLYFHQDEASG